LRHLAVRPHAASFKRYSSPHTQVNKIHFMTYPALTDSGNASLSHMYQAGHDTTSGAPNDGSGVSPTVTFTPVAFRSRFSRRSEFR
jgi:hypothetical protein